MGVDELQLLDFGLPGRDRKKSGNRIVVQLLSDRFEAARTLHMARTHMVVQVAGIGDDPGRRAHFWGKNFWSSSGFGFLVRRLTMMSDPMDTSRAGKMIGMPQGSPSGAFSGGRTEPATLRARQAIVPER